MVLTTPPKKQVISGPGCTINMLGAGGTRVLGLTAQVTLQAYLSALEIFGGVCLSSCTPSPGHREPSLESGPLTVPIWKVAPQCPSVHPNPPSFQNCLARVLPSFPGLHPCRLPSWPGNRQSNSRTTSAPSSQDPPRLRAPGQRTGHI